MIHESMAEFAVIQTGGKQYKVSVGPVSDEEMLNKLRAESQHKYLVGSIRENEGLIEPVYVREEAGGKRRVYEGNRRWAALHDLNEEDATAFGRVPVYVIPSDMGNEAWLKYLGILHDQGKTPWGGYSRAVYIRSMQNSGISVNEIAAFTGRSKADVTRAIATTGLVEEYAEYAKNKGLVERNRENKALMLAAAAERGQTAPTVPPDPTPTQPMADAEREAILALNNATTTASLLDRMADFLRER
jgi:hypothetical protein